MRKLIFSILFISTGILADTNVFNRPFYLVTPKSRIQVIIDQAVETMFNSTFHDELCALYPNSESLRSDLGITERSSQLIYQNCLSHKQDKVYGVGKFHKKKFMIGFEKGNSLDIDSWTSRDNTTYIFANGDLSKENLIRIIIHEIAVSIDAKMKMNYINYMDIEKFDPLPGAKTFTERLASLSEKESNISYFFNQIQSKAIQYTFSAMRAFNVEEMVFNKNAATMSTHKICEATFRKFYRYFANNLDNYVAKIKTPDVTEEFLTAMENFGSMTPDRAQAVLNIVLDERFTVEKPFRMSFCQYMATPKFSNKGYINLFASGPRPKITGGWNTSPDSIVEDLNLDVREKLIIEQGP